MKGMALTIVETRAVIGGVDTHADVHGAAALDGIGGLLGTESIPTTPAAKPAIDAASTRQTATSAITSASRIRCLIGTRLL